MSSHSFPLGGMVGAIAALALGGAREGPAPLLSPSVSRHGATSTNVSRLAPAVLTLLTLAGCGAATTTSSASTSAATGTPSAAATPAATPTQTSDATAGWAKYHSAANHITFRHPVTWVPQECGWVFLWGPVTDGDNNHCPTDGAGGIILAASDNGQQGSLSSISSNPQLYSNVQRSSVMVDEVTGTRIAADQSHGQGSGSSQVEYDFTSGPRSFTFLAYVKWAGYQPGHITQQFDQLVQTVMFD